MMTITEKVAFFTDFRFEDGLLTASDLEDNDYTIKEIMRHGNGDTYVTYLDGEEEITMTQHQGGRLRERVY